MKNYRCQDGCHNCADAFLRWEHDEGSGYYCTRGAPPRPPCMSVGMEECVGLMDDDNTGYRAANQAWDNWKKDREVERAGKCDDWHVQDEED